MNLHRITACIGLAVASTMSALAQGTPAFAQTDPGFHPAAAQGYACDSELALAADLASFASLFKQTDPAGWAVAKFRADGSLDAAWGHGGVTDLPSGRPASAILPLHDGGAAVIVDTSVLRYDANGRLVPEYGQQGRSDPVTANGAVGSFAAQADGSIVVQGVHAWVDPYLGNQEAGALTRIRPDGRRDTGFGNLGYVTLGPPQDATVFAWSVRVDGTVEVASYRIDANGAVRPELHRYPTDFASAESAGRLIPQAGVASWLAPTVAVDAYGGVLFGSSAPGGKVTLTRFGADGRLDAGFGFGGQAVVTVSGFYANDPTAAHAKALSQTTDGAWTVLAGVAQGMGGWAMIDVYYGTVAVRFRADGSPDPAFAQGVDLHGQSTRFVQMQTGELLNLAYSNSGSTSGCTLVKHLGDGPRADGLMVEYYHPMLDHYFVTVEGGESRGLDANVASMQWKRTGRAFGAWLPERVPGATNLCRFKGDAVGGPSSHFYSVAGAECEGLQQIYQSTPVGVPAWRYEGLAASVKVSVDGTCPANLWPVYRLYNDGFGRPGKESNHRYTTDSALYEQMKAQGWLPEGVHFCVPMPATRTSSY